MGKIRVFSALSVLLLCFCAVAPVAAEETPSLTVHDPAICLDVENRACVDANDVFPASVGRLFCFTKILGAEETLQISHVWFYGEVERARVDLTIRSSNFRTFSSKRIQPRETGNWHVDVLGPEGGLLKRITFEVVP